MNILKAGQENLARQIKRRRVHAEERRVAGRIMDGLLGRGIADRWAHRASERYRLMRQVGLGAAIRSLANIETRANYNGTVATYKIGFVAVWHSDQERLAGYDRVEIRTHREHVVAMFEQGDPKVVYSARIGLPAKVAIDKRGDFAPVPAELVEVVN